MHVFSKDYLYTNPYEDTRIKLDKVLSGREKRNKRRKEQRKKK